MANCTSGSATASELQTQIRAMDTGADDDAYVWEAATVSWDGTAAPWLK